MMHSVPSISLRRAVGGAVVAAAALAGGWAQAQAIDNVPPAVQNNVPPNFMFMIDTSGSMKNIVVGSPYSPTATYLASCPATKLIAPAETTTINIAVVNNAPYFRLGFDDNNPPVPNYRHVSLDATDGRCFDNAALYYGKLAATTGSTTKTPDGSYTKTQYSGHFLNWYFGNYSGAMTGWADRKPGSQNRMEVAKAAAKQAIDTLALPGTNNRPQVRVGLSSYQGSGGGLRVAMGDFTTTTRSTLRTRIDGLTASGYTPLASTLADIGRYMATGYTGNIKVQRTIDATPQDVNIDTALKLDGTDATRNACLAGAPTCNSTSSAKPIQYWCQRSSIFALTDGRPNLDRAFNNNVWIRDYDGDCTGSNKSSCVNDGAAGSWDRKKSRTYEDYGSDYMDDVAKLLFDVDLRPDLTKPAATATRPAPKNNVTTYMIGFADAAVQADPLLINTARQGGGRFIPATDGPGLERAFDQVINDAITQDAAAAAVAVTNAQITSGTVGYASSYVSGSWHGDLEAFSLDLTSGLPNGAAQWSARARLNGRTSASRFIASYDGSAGVAFSAANGGTFRTTTATLTDALIDYTRGDRSGEGSTFRPRNHLLGDIINAEPVVVNYSTGAVVFQAANDGMLHAFDGRVGVPTGGDELWAYVPRLVHGKLAGRASISSFEHEYLVDSTPSTAEVTGVGGVSRMLVGGLGKGGAGYYALDISTGTAADEAAAAAKVMWEFRPANMGYSFGSPLIVKTAAGWRVVVASGYRNDNGTDGVGGDGRGRVWVVNPATGVAEKEFVTPTGFGSATDPLGLAHLAKPNHLAASAVVRHVYGGDLKGNMWRFDLDAADGAAPVRIAAVKDGSNQPQPITVPPVVSPVKASPTKLLIHFGTGQYFSVDDVPGGSNATATQTQTIYGIVDDPTVAAPTLPDIRGTHCNNGGNGDLVCQKATTSGGTVTISHESVDLSTKRGFYLDIPIAGGRVNTQAALTPGGTLVMIVNVPSNVTCEPGGSSYLFQLSGSTGGAIVKTFGGSEYFQAVFPIGRALSSRPVIIVTSTGPRALLRLSDKRTEAPPLNETAGSAPKFRRVYMRPLN